jgi:hypothetical protein
MGLEVEQASGAGSRICMAKEANWGVLNPSANWKFLNVVGGEGLDENLTIYRSEVIRRDGMMNRSVRGSTRPGGPLPFELAPLGVNQHLYHLFGWHVSTSAAGGGIYVHTLKGDARNVTLPAGFTIEKGFTDLVVPDYAGIKGGRVASMNLGLNVDSAPRGTFQIEGREWYHSTTSLVSGTPTDLTSDPFTSVDVDISIYESTSAVLLGTVKNATLDVNRNLITDNNVLGTKFRANLKPGTRMTTFGGTFIFDSFYLYDKAIAGTGTKVVIDISDGTYSHNITLPNFEFEPNNSSPKITSGGPLEIPLSGLAAKDTSTGTDIVWVITTTEAVINN